MAKVTVSRQSVDEENHLSWVLVDVEEEDLFENEIPDIDFSALVVPQPSGEQPPTV